MSIFCHPQCKMGVHLPSHALCRTNNKAFIWFPCLLAKYHNQHLLSIHRLVLCKHSMLHGIDNDNKPIMTSRPTYLFTVKS